MSYAGLERVEGPACPRCGCQDSEPDRRRGRWGGSTTRYRCRHCGASWYPRRRTRNGEKTEQEETEETEPISQDVSPGGAVIYRPIRCPECGSSETKVTSTRRPVRHHKCRACGAAFKSVERDA